jgi:sugar/nucleoside kinase (ribokinase family)
MSDPQAVPMSDGAVRPAATAPAADLLSVGQLFLDVLYGPLPSAPVLGQELFTDGVSLVPGGIANFAAAATALGAHAEIAAPIGDGPLSALTRTLLTERGIGTDALEVHEGWDLQLTTALSYEGDRALVTAGLPPVGREEAPRGLDRARSVAVHLELEEMPWLAETPGRLYADVGWDPSGVWDRAMLRHLAHCHAFLPNADEAQAYTRTDTPLEAARALAELVPLSVVTCGGDGVLALESSTGAEVRIPALTLGPVDPTGAGDTFGAALIVLRDRGLPLREAVEGACLAATARAAGVVGPAVTPTLRQLAELARDHRLTCAEALFALAQAQSPEDSTDR